MNMRSRSHKGLYFEGSPNAFTTSSGILAFSCTKFSIRSNWLRKHCSTGTSIERMDISDFIIRPCWWNSGVWIISFWVLYNIYWWYEWQPAWHTSFGVGWPRLMWVGLILVGFAYNKVIAKLRINRGSIWNNLLTIFEKIKGVETIHRQSLWVYEEWLCVHIHKAIYTCDNKLNFIGDS